jgi:hypothetical protein
MNDAGHPVAPAGLRNQVAVRTALRVLGPIMIAVGLALVVVAGYEFFTLEGFEEPTRFWMFFVGLPLLGFGGMVTQAGFAGVAARYASGELAPVVKDAASYLSDGRGVLAVGASGANGPYCRSCGTRNDADARFCDACGTSTG